MPGPVPAATEVSTGGGSLILNDERAVRACVETQGLGFLVLSGEAEMDDDGSFVAWHRAFKARQGKKVAPSNSGLSRMRKRAFKPLRVEAFWIGNDLELDAALAAGSLAVRPVGRQPPKAAGESGAARADKFQMHLVRARRSLRVADQGWTHRG